MSRASRVALATASAALLAACGSSPNDPSAGSAGKRKAAIGARPKAVDADAGQPSSEPDAAQAQDASLDDPASDLSTRADPPPTNVSFETARVVKPGGRGVWQTRHSESQVDYFAFEATAGAFYELTTDDNVFSPDNTISLYDSDRSLVAENDDGSMWPGDAIDSRLVVRLPLAGTYFVRIEDRTLPVFDPQAPLPYYHFTLRAVEHDTPGFAFESEAGAEPAAVAFLDDETTGFAFATLLGDMSPDQSEVFAFMGRSDHVLDGEILESGVPGNGSTALFGRLQVASADQGHVLARIERARGQHNIHPPVDAQAYRLALTPGGEPGQNGFYAIDLVLLPDNPREQMDEANGTLAGAEAIAMQGSISRRGLLLASLPPGDVDYYKFDAAEREHVLVACEAESGGSGVRGLVAEVRDDKDQVVGSAVESPDANLKIEELPIAVTGTHYLRLSGMPSMEQDMAEPWTRCVVIVGP